MRQPLLHDLAVTLRAPTVCLSGADGQIRDMGTQGVLSGDVRVLGRAVLTVDGVEPETVAHGVDGASAEHFIGLLRGLGDPGADPTVWVRRDRTVRADGISETLTLVNRTETDLAVTLEVAVGADMAPIEIIKSGAAGTPIDMRGSTWSGSGVHVTLDAPGAAVDGSRLRWPVAVPARSTASCGYALTVRDGAAIVAGPPATLDRTLTVHADDRRLARLLGRALDDLDALLLTEVGYPDLFAGAGAPWYLTLFGRDSLWTATLLLPVDVRLAAGTLRTLARAQGQAVDPATGEEPGKIPHERRRAESQYVGDTGGDMTLPALYYGTVDATALWICLLRDAWRWGMPVAEVAELMPNLRAALGWIRDHSDRDGDGFVEYFDDSGRGLANQGWKDSADAVRYASGEIADGPVALVEVQGYAAEAARAGAELLDAFVGDGAPQWRRYADDMAARFRERFWVDGHPGLALDGEKKLVDALTSNIGHLLGTGLLDDAESETVGARLLGPDMASGFGLRTMSSAAGGYNPLSYHCGSVWPHDTAIVMRGLARAGQHGRAAELGRQLLDAAEGFGFRLPELYSGFAAAEVAAPVPYAASCRPQAWSAAAAVALLSALLGLTVDVPAGTITLRPPSPSPVGAVQVRGMAVGGGRLDVDIDRAGTVTHVAVPSGMRVEVGAA
jgi:glycogen debranching enzyme